MQVLKSFMAYDIRLHPGEIIDASNWNLTRINKLIAQRFMVPVKIEGGELKPTTIIYPVKPAEKKTTLNR